MSAETPSKMKVEEFASTYSDRLIPLNAQFSYFCSPSMPEEDVKQYLHEPIAALPGAICKQLPRVAVMLVPFLDKGNGRSGVRVSYEALELAQQTPTHRVQGKDSVTLFFATKDEEISEYHYSFYNELAGLVARGWPSEVRDTFLGVLRGELTAKVNGEIDEKSWAMKQALLRRPVAREKVFKEYGRQAFEDTLTLYLHGICCDIDVETGPRQMPSRYVRKRLEALHALFPPPAGHAVFPEELNRVAGR
ncbi:MAG: hypothetical protein JWO80_3945 [Bryobacterales bacterium]|nr:hypothetical protein [Bryobacterales bacterium]